MKNKLYANIKVKGLEKLKDANTKKSIEIDCNCTGKSEITLKILEA